MMASAVSGFSADDPAWAVADTAASSTRRKEDLGIIMLPQLGTPNRRQSSPKVSGGLPRAQASPSLSASGPKWEQVSNSQHALTALLRFEACYTRLQQIIQ